MDQLPLSHHVALPLDNAAIVDFISTSAGVFNKKGYLKSRDSDSLRAAISSLQSREGDCATPLLQTLMKKDLEFLHILCARYGMSRLSSNVLRYTLKSEVQRLNLVLSHWGNKIIPLAKQSFNRPFPIYSNNECEGQALYSGILIYLSEVISSSCEKLNEAVRLCNFYFPHSMASNSDSDLELDLDLAESLGFEHLCLDPFPRLSDKAITKLVFEAVQELIEAVMEITTQMNHSTVLESSSTITILCEWIGLDANKLLSSRFSSTSHLLAWDISRQLFLGSMYMIRKNCEKLTEGFDSLVKEHQQNSRLNGAYKVSKDLERKITSQLISGGIGAKTADLATRDLVQYLQKNTLKPRELIFAELNKINHALTPKSLELLQEFSQTEQLATVSLKEKERTFKKAQSLSSRFNSQISNLSKVLALLFLSAFFVSCGLKMSPKSDMVDFRPGVPFKGGVLEDEQKEQTKK